MVPESVRQVLRQTVGEPPSHVTVHEGGSASSMTDAVNAEAFTKNGQIYFADDAPVSSTRGQQLLAHELTHVMQQQSRSASMPGESTDEGRELEHAARQVEEQMIKGPSQTVRPVALAKTSANQEPSELHHRIGPMQDGSSNSGSSYSGSPFSGSSSSSFSGGGSTIAPRSGSSISGGSGSADAGVQRREREPSRGILDGIGEKSARAWSKARESLYGQLEQDFAPPEGKKETDSRAKRLEKQAAELYPFLRRRLRAELVRDLERRGRL